ncbi:MAG: hypothetical protein Q4D68_00355 [Moraxella equi]|nr:hypothetical protein [Moraxella equi]
MSKNKQGLRPEDEKMLRDLIKQNKEVFAKISAMYFLKDDLVEVTNRSYSATKIIENEVDHLKLEINKLIDERNRVIQSLGVLSQLNSQIEKFKSLIEQEYSDEELLIDRLEEILNQDEIDEIGNLRQEIINFHSEIYDCDDDESIHSRINDFLINMNKAQKFLTETVEFEGVSVAKKEVIRKEYEKIHDYYDYLFDDSGEDSISKDLNKKISDLNKFYQKIFGNENNKTISLKDDLEKRLIQLKEVEEEAKKVINLASDAGLAGGFVEKAKEAKTNKIISIIILSLALCTMFFYNKDIFNGIPKDQESINNYIIIWNLLKLLINAPLLWLAIVANINLNKYSRLEQDYAHKEALAKSYERYKTEISKLSSEDEQAENLKQELIRINLEAFKLNPADNMDKAKSDTIMDKILTIKYLNEDKKGDEKKDE